MYTKRIGHTIHLTGPDLVDLLESRYGLTTPINDTLNVRGTAIGGTVFNLSMKQGIDITWVTEETVELPPEEDE